MGTVTSQNTNNNSGISGLDFSGLSGIKLPELSGLGQPLVLPANFDMPIDLPVFSGGGGGGASQVDTEYLINNAFTDVQKKYPFPTNCIDLDKILATLTKDAADYSLLTDGDPNYLIALQRWLKNGKLLFVTQDCRNLIEQQRLNESALLLEKYTIQSENKTLNPSSNTQLIYIGIGSAVILMGLYIILKSK